MRRVWLAIPVMAGACSAPDPQDQFFAALKEHCGKAYEGRLVSSDEADRDIGAERLIMDVRGCETDTVRIPFHVGANRSRTWVVTRQPDGLRLKHDHRHEDGAEDTITQYGGDTAGRGAAVRQEFPADQFSKDLFAREGLAASVDNVWAIEITDATFAYELKRSNRFFRVEFDLTKPVENPPAALGLLTAERLCRQFLQADSCRQSAS